MKRQWTRFAKVCMILCVVIAATLTAHASELSISLTGQTDYTEEWYMEPWIWILSGGVFILLFTVILSGKDSDA
jgi:hypothetical protein